uniref:Uncharacterized protein n=1 Tax=Candidatus Kentrum sp. DK TaxID=2126562 RepID=A0A450TKD8_9GAMM|nr:MAG: hypothetical protein BECKDK2373B_GA0170837_12063 [Candidatus Kentron sp. DK]
MFLYIHSIFLNVQVRTIHISKKPKPIRPPLRPINHPRVIEPGPVVEKRIPAGSAQHDEKRRADGHDAEGDAIFRRVPRAEPPAEEVKPPIRPGAERNPDNCQITFLFAASAE